MDIQSLSPIEAVADRAVTFGVTLPSSGDPFARFLPPECLLPVQYNALLRKRISEQGERRLLLAVLKDALRCYIKNMSGRSARARREFEEISDWFYAEDQEGIFAYQHLCEALGIHPEPLRRWLESLKDGNRQVYLRASARC